MKVRDVMTTPAVTVRPDTTFADVVEGDDAPPYTGGCRFHVRVSPTAGAST